MERSTQELLALLKKNKSYPEFEEQTMGELTDTVPLCEYLNELLEEKGLKKSEVILASGLDRSYAYDIFSGKKQPAREKVLMLCLGARLTIDEVQTLLKKTGYPMLYARNRRDSVLLFSLEHALSLMDVNELLYEMQEAVLE